MSITKAERVHRQIKKKKERVQTYTFAPNDTTKEEEKEEANLQGVNKSNQRPGEKAKQN